MPAIRLLERPGEKRRIGLPRLSNGYLFHGLDHTHRWTHIAIGQLTPASTVTPASDFGRSGSESPGVPRVASRVVCKLEQGLSLPTSVQVTEDGVDYPFTTSVVVETAH